MEVLVRVAVATSFMVLVSGSFNPLIIEIGWFVFFSTVAIAMAMIGSIFGTVMNDLAPFVSVAVLLHNLL